MAWLLSCFGFILNFVPDIFAQQICRFFGYMFYYGMRSRRHILLKNLFIAFPEKPEAWRRYVARINCCRWVETVWLFLTSACWDKEKILKNISISTSLRSWIENFNRNPRATIVVIPHLNLMEMMTWVPCCFKQFPQTGVIYRPFRANWFENWIRHTRERFGIRLISRKQGILAAEKILKNNGLIGILFDQSAGEAGCLTTFFDRLASCTDLPGRLVERFHADVVAVYIKRTGFLRSEVNIDEIETSLKPLSIMINANKWLEQQLKNKPEFYNNWLWLHRRWKTQCREKKRFQIYQKRNFLSETCKYFHWENVPRRTQIWIRMPNWLGDCIMSYPILKALRQARPDFCIHAIAKAPLASFIQQHFPVDFVHILPTKSNFWYFKKFWMIRQFYPDIWLSFSTSSFRQLLEAACSGADQRFFQPFQAFLQNINTYQSVKNNHQTEIWYHFLQQYGLNIPISKDPFYPFKTLKKSAITSFGCFCGSANSPKKRWPVHHWIILINQLLQTFSQAQCILLGIQQDNALNAKIAAALPSSRVKNLSGKTDLIQLENNLLQLNFVIGNDSGGIHLSNFLGIPIIALFGYTQPTFGGPFFNGEKHIIQSPTHHMGNLQPSIVYEKIMA